jgi:hypothetical protein
MDNFDDAPATFRLQAAVAEFAELLRGSFWAEDGNFGAVMSVLRSLEDDLGDDENFTEFEQLVSLATRYQDR